MLLSRRKRVVPLLAFYSSYRYAPVVKRYNVSISIYLFIYLSIYTTQQHPKSRPSLYIYTVHLHFALSSLNAVFSVSANSDFTNSSSCLGSLPPFFPPLFSRLLGLRRSVCVTTFSSTLVLILSVTILISYIHSLFLSFSLFLTSCHSSLFPS